MSSLEPVKRVTAATAPDMSNTETLLASGVVNKTAAAHYVGSVSYPSSSWGSATLHPRLYAGTRFAGSRAGRFVLLVAFCFCLLPSAAAQNWPSFRGQNGSGIADGNSPPTVW